MRQAGQCIGVTRNCRYLLAGPCEPAKFLKNAAAALLLFRAWLAAQREHCGRRRIHAHRLVCPAPAAADPAPDLRIRWDVTGCGANRIRAIAGYRFGLFSLVGVAIATMR